MWIFRSWQTWQSLVVVLLWVTPWQMSIASMADPELVPVESRQWTQSYDIYLTGNRICKKCQGRQINAMQVELRNASGQVGLYSSSEIVGVDNQPIFRKLMLQGLHGIGLPARIIVPQAFDDEPRYLHY